MKKEILKTSNLVMSESDMKSLNKISDAQGCSVSWLVRQAVKAYLNKERESRR